MTDITMRQQSLDAAARAVLQDRNKTYGGPEDSFATTAAFWSTFLGVEIKATDVAPMLALLKLARLSANPTHQDSYVDLAGYAACGAEVADNIEMQKATGG
jgi:hypothetical protein